MKLRSVWLLCSVALLAGNLACAQKIEVAPAQVPIDQSASILVKGATPGARLTIQANLTDGNGRPWASQAEFIADAHGSIDTATEAPVKGSYRKVSAMGLVWSMRPAKKGVHSYLAPRNFAPQQIQFRLLQEGREISSVQLTQIAIGPDVQQIRVNGGLHGILFLPGSAGKHPGVLVLGGSEGGVPRPKAAWLASHGYVAFALCYFRCPDDPGTPRRLENIPLEYFGQALAWMAQRPEVAADRLAVVGTSRGGELALQLGSMYPEIKAVVAYVPANLRYPACCMRPPQAAWTWRGEPLAWATPRQNASLDSINAQIAIEHTNGPILMLSASNDGVWPSALMVKAAAQRLRASHFPFQVVVLNYDHAGHRAGFPVISPTWSDGIVNSTSGRTVDLGGTPQGNAESSLDAIPKVLGFLEKNLDQQSATK